MILFFYCLAAALIITISLGLLPYTVFFLPVVAYFVIEFFGYIRGKTDSKINYKKTDIIFVIIIFIFLTSISLNNIYKNPKNIPVNTSEPTSKPIVIVKSPTQKPLPKITIDIKDGSKSINIRQKPSLYSDKIGEAKHNDSYEYTQKIGEWYEIKIAEDKLGYVSQKYVK